MTPPGPPGVKATNGHGVASIKSNNHRQPSSKSTRNANAAKPMATTSSNKSLSNGGSPPNSHAGHQSSSSSPRVTRRGAAAAATNTQNMSSLHRPGRIPSYLSRSPLSASTGKLNSGGGGGVQMRPGSHNKPRSRPASRDLDKTAITTPAAAGKSSSSRNAAVAVPGFSRPLAPTAKFRSDGEISICDSPSSSSSAPETAKPKPGQQQASSLESCSDAPPRGQRQPRIRQRPCNKSGGGESRSLPATPAKNSASVVGARRPLPGGGGGRDTSSTVEEESKSCNLGGGTWKEVAASAAAVSSSCSSASEHRRQKNSAFKVRSRSLTFFQRLGGALARRSSFKTSKTSEQSASSGFAAGKNPEGGGGGGGDQDWVFFRGFSGQRREQLNSLLLDPCDPHGPFLGVASASLLSPEPPPRRRTRPRRRSDEAGQYGAPLRRSLSLTDAHFIAQAVCEGDSELIQELYPEFPRSEPIYAVVDKSKKRRNRPASHFPTTTTTATASNGASAPAAAAADKAVVAVAPADPSHQKQHALTPPLPGSINSNGASMETVAPSLLPLSGVANHRTSVSAAASSSDPTVLQHRKSSSAAAATFVSTTPVAAAAAAAPHSNWRQQHTAAAGAGHQHQHHPERRRNNVFASSHSQSSASYDRANNSSGVTFSSPVMFVRQQEQSSGGGESNGGTPHYSVAGSKMGKWPKRKVYCVYVYRYTECMAYWSV